MFTQNDYLNKAEKLMASASSDVQDIVNSLHRAIECGTSGTNQGASNAYVALGKIAAEFSAGVDGGYGGIGFYALALLHDSGNEEARNRLMRALQDESPDKFVDDPLLRVKLEHEG